MLACYDAPPLDEGIDEALRSFITQRRGNQPDTSY
jgi:trimethylamine:corrinoid methyltransferase-like protein